MYFKTNGHLTDYHVYFTLIGDVISNNCIVASITRQFINGSPKENKLLFLVTNNYFHLSSHYFVASIKCCLWHCCTEKWDYRYLLCLTDTNAQALMNCLWDVLFDLYHKKKSVWSNNTRKQRTMGLLIFFPKKFEMNALIVKILSCYLYMLFYLY